MRRRLRLGMVGGGQGAFIGVVHRMAARLDDHVQVMMRYANGARGTLWASQVATGCENALSLRVYGSQAQLRFDQENPNVLSGHRFIDTVIKSHRANSAWVAV